MKARMSSKFGQIRTPTVELAALERLKNPNFSIYTQQKTFCTDGSSGKTCLGQE